MKFDWRSLFGMGSSRPSTIISFRKSKSNKAIVLLHGFTGEVLSSWDGFYQRILEDDRVLNWDVFGLSYPTTPSVDTWSIMKGDPSLNTLSISLSTTTKLGPFGQYEDLAFAAHSMGGLFLQRALIDHLPLRERTKHVFLFGTPSLGIPHARLIGSFKKQAEDMSEGSAFVTKLRTDWSTTFAAGLPFSFAAVAGDIDEFVPVKSSLEPFALMYREVVSGDHSTMIKCTDENRQSVDLVCRALSGQKPQVGASAAARLDLESGNFQLVVDSLLPHADQLDEAALTSLALALDGLDRGVEAVDLLEANLKNGEGKSSEALGTLAGRVKRRWLVERRAQDLARAVELYQQGYVLAAEADDHNQGYYHAINLSFLHLLSSPLNSKLSAEVETWANRALWHCERAPLSNWRLATEAEANLLLGNRLTANRLYAEAVAGTNSPRQLGSMYSQASRIADRLYGSDGLSDIKNIFDRFRE